ncbi:MAG: HAMP domain-containing protein, partial [Burkholderiales bacterium]
MAARRSIYRKYLALIIALVAGALVVSGAIGIYFSYLETRHSLISLAHEKAASAATRIEQFVKEIENQVAWTTLPQISEGTDPLEPRRFDFVRLVKLVQPITEANYIHANGCLQVKESRLEIARVGECLEDLSKDARFASARAAGVYYGPVYFRKETEPYMAIALRAIGGGVSTVEVNLKFIWEVIQRIKIGEAGLAYVVNKNGHLIAHPDISLVLQKTDFSTLPQVQAALQAKPAEPGDPSRARELISEARDRNGRNVITAYARIEPLDWYVFVEQPTAEAYQPLYASLARSGALLVAGLLLSILAGLVFARRMTNPIRALQDGAAAIGAGDLNQKIEVRTGDELQQLAEQFNKMAGDLKESYAGLERKVEERTAELKETLGQQTATAEILRVISGSPTDVQPVFDAIVQSGLRLFEGAAVAVALPVGDQVRAAAIAENDPAQAAMWKSRFPVPLTRDYMHSAAILDRALLDIPDAAEVKDAWQAGIRNFLATGYRAMTIMPMLRGDAAIGAISVLRRQPGPLSEKQIALLKTFADQAVIAIENVRLFNETKEALEQQTATSEILRAISGSMTEAQPVFDAIVKNCHALFVGSRVALGLLHEDRIEVRASVGGAAAADTYE